MCLLPGLTGRAGACGPNRAATAATTRALAQRIEVDAKEVRIMGSKSELLRTLKRKNGRFCSAQFCTEVAHPTRFERVTFAFGGQGLFERRAPLQKSGRSIGPLFW